MATQASLRVVSGGRATKRAAPRKATAKRAARKAPAQKQPTTVKAAADVSERALLVALRTQLAESIDGGVPAHTLAALVKQLRELDHDIRLIDARAKGAGDGDQDEDADEVPDDEDLDPSEF